MTTKATLPIVSAVISLAFANFGCSFVFSKGPNVSTEEVTAESNIECSSSAVPPVFDAGLALTHSIGAIWGATQLKHQSGVVEDVLTAAIVADLAFAVLHGISAVYGSRSAMACSDVQERQSKLQQARSLRIDNDAANKAPNGAFGFTFGMTRLEAERACASSGRAWTSDEGGAACDGKSAASGETSHTELQFGPKGLWSVDVSSPPGAQWSRTFEQIQHALRTRYGAPSRSHFEVPEACASMEQAIACAERGDMRVITAWGWPNRTRVALQVRAVSGKLVIRMLYEQRRLKPATAPETARETAPETDPATEKPASRDLE